MEDHKYKMALLIESDTPILMKNIDTGDIIHSVIVNGDVGDGIDNSEKEKEAKEPQEKTQKSDKNKKKEDGKKSPQNIKDKFYKILSQYFLLGLIIILLGFIFASKFEYFEYKENYVGLILAFVGILATFIVVSNYAQVKEAKDEFSTKVKEAEKKFDEKKEEIEVAFNRKIEISEEKSASVFNVKFIEIELKFKDIELKFKDIESRIEDIELKASKYGNIPLKIIKRELNSVSIMENGIRKVNDFLYTRNCPIKYSIGGPEIEIIIIFGCEAHEYVNSSYPDVSINGKKYNYPDDFSKLLDELESFVRFI
ncbi:MAG: hypothetical protein LBE13_07565 [Bacteroidales bacterium]|jgi:hypothetical protein|nr:hypothetical protein [Bacteroidales bacterium]